MLVDLSITNLTDEDRQVYIPWELHAMVRDGSGRYSNAETVDEKEQIAISELCSTEKFYLSRHGEGRSFYFPTLKANETAAITVGWLADEDMLDQLYLTLCPSVDSVCSPAYPTDDPYLCFVMKVQEDDR